MKIDNQIKEWVEDAIRKGYNNEEIISILNKEGYDKEEIEKILAVFNVRASSERMVPISKIKDNEKGILKKLTGKKQKKQVPREIKEIAGLLSRVRKEAAKVVEKEKKEEPEEKAEPGKAKEPVKETESKEENQE